MGVLSEDNYQKILSLMDEVIASSEFDFRNQVLLSFEKLFGFDRSNFWMCDENNDLTNLIMLNGNLQARDDYLKNYYRLDYFIPKRVNHLLNKQRVLRIEDIIPLQSYEKSEYYNEFMARYGYYHTMGVYLHDGNKLLGLIDFVRSKNERPFTNSDVRCLEVISRYLTQKLKMYLLSKESSAGSVVLQPSANHPENNLQAQKQYGLTLKESEVLALVQQGYSNIDIADQLFISTNTVKKHLQSIYRKFGVSNRTSLCHKVYTN